MRALVLSALEPVDSDVDLDDPAQRRELYRRHSVVLAVIAAGGVLGALLRYQLTLWWPAAPPGFPWTTLTINLTGSLVLGAFMVLITRRWSPHALTRPFFGTGVLGGYTTFSTFTVDIVELLRDGHPGVAGSYLAATTLGALVATGVGMSLASRMATRSPAPGSSDIDPDLDGLDDRGSSDRPSQGEHR